MINSIRRVASCIALLAAFALPAIAEPSAESAAPVLDNPLIAHWTFDEPAGPTFRDAGPAHHDAAADPEARIERVAGVFGNAVQFNGQHVVRTGGDLQFDQLKQISFSVWVIPARAGKYAEIFRKEDGNNRVLFSFQDNFTHLSLGLNVGGYVECDAPITPAAVFDGKWHHCAATFDGKAMRVYLDGEPIGALDRPGRIKAGGTAPAYIASMNGSECFKGAMDDLRIYSESLSSNDIGMLYRTGKLRVDAGFARLVQRAEQLCPIGEDFARTLEGARKAMADACASGDLGLRRAIVARIRRAFSADLQNFTEVTGADPAAYIGSVGDEFHARVVGRVIELMLEYKPLTPQQWQGVTVDEAARWREADGIAARYEQLKAEAKDKPFTPEWVAIMLEAGARVMQRPYKSEAVAPYVAPSTPATCDLSSDEARRVMERDWLYQADDRPTPKRVADEIGWTRRVADRLLAQSADGKLDFRKELAELDAMEKLNAAAGLDAAAIQGLYLKIRQLKRSILLRNPVLDFDQLVMVDMPLPQGNERNHETRHRLGYMAVPGARLLVLEGLSPAGHLRQLMPQAPLHGSFWRPDVSYDGSRVLFCFKPHNEKSFHIYQINADGSGLVQLTRGPYDDLDPIYLPDGRHILFSTTRAHTYVRCMPPTNAFVLARADADGRNVYIISSNNEPDYLPSVLHDGRVVYTRWEYTDKPLWRDQKLWTINPDGTQVGVLWGSQSVWPDVVKDARAIPNSRRVMFTGSAHHNWFGGSVGILDPAAGLNFPDGLTKVTADVIWPECGNGPVDPIESHTYHRSGNYPAYNSPYPLSEQDFLVSAQRGDKFCLYLMDVEGNRELIYEGQHHIFHAMPLRARPRPPIIADRVQWPTVEDRERPQQGVIFSADVYEGAPSELRGKAAALRVWHIDEKTYTYWNKRPYVSTGPVVSIVQSEGVKRLLGTVPIEPDGSVKFAAPAGTSLHFQLLDARGRALHTMRSFVNVMPGETRGCLGCHESHSRAPVSGYSAAGGAGGATALALAPRQIVPPPWADVTVSYPRYVQPLFDRYCNVCHTGAGEATKVLDLSDKPGALGFSEPYFLLTGRPSWGKPYVKPEKTPPGFGCAGVLMVEGYSTTDPAAYRTTKPLASLSYASPLVELCSSGKHYGVKVDDVSLARLIAWVDAMCPYNGDEEIRQIPDPVFQGVDWLAIRPLIQTAPRIARPGPVD